MFIKKVLAEIFSFSMCKNKNIYLVGGFLRDLYLGNPGCDLDFAVSGDALSFAWDVSEILEGTFVPLDRRNGVARVILDCRDKKWQIDFATLKGWSLEEDLSNRDFTINAMALELSTYIRLAGEDGCLTGRKPDRRRLLCETVIDPFGGLADMENKIIRAVNNYIFEADPLRILRGIRLAGKLGFSIKPETLNLMERDRWLLHEVAGERIWEELLGILDLPESYSWIALMDVIGALSEIFPFVEKMKITDQNNYHVDNVWIHSLKTYKALEDIYRKLGNDGLPTADRGEELYELLLNHLEYKILSERKRIQLIKLAALFHDAGKADTAKVLADGRITFPKHPEAGLVYVHDFARRLKISKAEEYYLKKLVGNHMYPLYLFINQPIGPAAIHRLFRKLEKNTTDVFILSLADLTATYIAGGNYQDLAKYRNFIVDLLHKYHFEADNYINLPQLVKGSDLIKKLGITPSKKVGYLLKKISCAQACGKITNRDEAIAYASRLLAQIED